MIIDNEFKSLLPPLPEEDYRGLEESLKKEGCRDPLVVWGDVLVDGHNRYEICTAHSIPYQTVQREFKDRNEVILWIISNQLSRRNLTAFQRSELALRLKPKLEAEARERMSEGGKNKGSRKTDTLNKPERTDTKLAEVAGVSKDTIRNTETILTQGTPEDITEVREGKASISGKAKEIKKRKDGTPVKEDPESADPFQTVVIDNVLRGTLYEVWKTLNGVEKRYSGKMSKSDEKELRALLTKVQAFIDKKGGTEYEKSE